ncbi:FAD-dependent monooxygenase [Actinoplanes xinjiangensis]|uniref:2-polyprenyl-6-methoxyphenol hydroxylase-like FAD-dependent oxidoreductase n=1 Tax=Actinoplanes xinjiangensis TaxID=512350 RepID=A0A316EJF4_9ACTN|nr:FAD-dependent monooxygenase [Actinoplanes xinjiangensis]PWK29826.1 2-polyprenyl-6-methoxyphenol hydroxylase-like FAD-dependent oxidoreductase [Actinoplanes xinjiangensis]GIF44858.1 monooxygenase [Actinoplanes xinjiangensis]
MGERVAAIIGGGIGGLAAAVALRRTGWRVTVHERAPAFTEVGAGISLWPNALHALDRLGLLGEVLSRAEKETAGGAKDRRGRWLTRVTSDQLERRFGHPVVVLHRGRLLEALLTALPEDVLRPGTTVTDLPEADLVVAADGLRSTVRSWLWPGVHPRYAGHTAWRMVARPASPPREGAVLWGRGERFGYAPMPGGTVYCFGTATVPECAATVPEGAATVPKGAATVPEGAATVRAAVEYAEVLRRFRNWPDPVPALLDAVDPGAVLRHDLYDLPPLPSFVRGTTVLLGDAAHAMTPSLGQGGCQALEDAVVLADCLAASGTTAGLARYDALRRPRTQAIVTRSARLNTIGQIAWPPAAAARDLLVRLVPAEVVLRGMTSVIGFRV